jgi:hypothetical protein
MNVDLKAGIFEKRLRDVSTLKSWYGTPDQLKLFLAELSRGDG